MPTSAPWSVKGIDPESREAAKIAARKAGMTLGAWLNRTIRAAAAEPPLDGDGAPAAPPAPDPAAQALVEHVQTLSRRLDEQEARAEESLAPLTARIETLAASLEQLRALGQRPVPEAAGTLLPLSERLDTLAEEVSEAREHGRQLETAMAEAIGPLVEKIDAFALALEQLRNNPDAARLAEEVAALSSRLDAAPQAPAADSEAQVVVERAVVRLAERLQKLEETLAETPRKGVFGRR